jgi:hypothetical protein
MPISHASQATVGTILTNLATVDTVVDNTYTEALEVERHLHGSNYVYGLTTSNPILLTRPSTTPIRVTGGSDAFGTSVLLDKGTMAGAYYDPGKIQVVAVETANVPTIIRFYSATLGGAVAYTWEADDEIVTASGHGLVDNDRVIFDTMSPDETHGATRSIVYHVINMSGSTFKVALTSGGAAVTIDQDLSGNIKKVTPTFATEIAVSMAATNSDSGPITFPCPRIASTSTLYCEARSHGAAKYVDFFLDLHTYAS